MERRHVLVTGANKGIGLAIVERLLRSAGDVFVYVGARDTGRGQAAVRGLTKKGREAAWGQRVELVLIDPTCQTSVDAAAAALKSRGVVLHAIVNNAGGFMDFTEMLELHLYGTKRVTDAMLELLDPRGGRVVNMTSGGAPACVARCRADHRATLTSRSPAWEDIDGLARQVEAAVTGLPADASDEEVREATGIGWGLRGYGFTKALVTSYTAHLQGQHPALIVNACNPGFIETDLSRPYAEQCGKTPGELGMRPVDDGAVVPCMLVLEDVDGRGSYYHSDGRQKGFAECDPDDFES